MEVKCIYQMFPYKSKRNGDCRICISDSKNKDCEFYVPVKIYTINVIIKGKEKG